MADYFGWDIGGVHLKAARLSAASGRASLATRILGFEIWRDPAALTSRLRSLRDARSGPHAVTMTAELSDVFPTRAEGVRAILGACAEVLPGPPRVLNLRGRLVTLDEALERPLEAAAANWMASAKLVALARREALLIDIGSTTTDIVPVRDREPRPAGRTDTERLMVGELVYTGVLRTPPASLADRVPLAGGWCRVCPEHFTVMGDVYRVLGAITEEEYTVPTPDGRGRSRNESMARLARLVGADPATIGPTAVETMAHFLQERQVDQVARAIVQVRALWPGDPPSEAIVAGAGSFLADCAARRAGLTPVRLDALFPRLGGDDWSRAAPSAALAVLLAAETGDYRFTS